MGETCILCGALCVVYFGVNLRPWAPVSLSGGWGQKTPPYKSMTSETR